MRIPSTTTDQGIYFVAVDATDLKTRETGLSGFVVYRARNGASAVAMTTPTVTQVDATNLPGVYHLLLDEDMTIGTGNDSEEMVFHITVAGMAPVTRVIELYRPKITLGETLATADIASILQDTGTTLQAELDGIQADTEDIQSRLPAALVGGRMDSSVGAMAANTLTASALATDAVAELVDAVWDESLTGATHNVPNSAGRRLRVAGTVEVHAGTAQAGSTSTTFVMDTGASSVNNMYHGDRIVIVEGTAAVEHGIITSYVGATRTATMDTPWNITPDATSQFVVFPASVDVATWNKVAVTGDGDWTELQTTASDILVDTGTTLPATLTTIDGVVDAILVDTDTTLPGLLNTIDGVVDAILVDTDTTIPALLTTIDGVVDSILVDTDATIPGLISGLNNLSAAQVNAEVDTALADYDAPTATEMTSAFTQIKGAGWSGSTDTLEAISDAVAGVSGGGGGGDATQAKQDTIIAALAVVDGIVDSILVDTAELQTDLANGGRLDLLIDGIKAKTDALPASPASTGDLASLATTANVSAVETKVDTLLARITATLFSGITSLAQWLGAMAGKQTPNSTAQTELRASGAGGGTYTPSTDSLEALSEGIAGVETGGDATLAKQEEIISDIAVLSLAVDALTPTDGGGDNVVTVTITDENDDPLEAATVTAREGVNSFRRTTDANGECVFLLSNATWELSPRKDGYDPGAATSLVVNGTEAITITMAAPEIALPSDPSFCTVAGTLTSGDGEPIVAERVEFYLSPVLTGRIAPPSKTTAGALITQAANVCRTDANGNFSIELVRNDDIIPANSQWRMVIRRVGVDHELTLTAATYSAGTFIV
jgi:hypothetical protein